jgi:hypothetical protein
MLLLSMMVLAACGSGSSQDNLWLKSDDWSRGAFIAETQVGSPVSFVSGSDNDTFFFLVDLDEETSNYSFNVARMDSNSDALEHMEFSVGVLQSVKQPQIVREGSENLRLFWIASEGLYTLVVSEEGSLVGDPVLLSGENAVSSYDLAVAPDGRVTLWYAGSRRSPGIYALSEYDGSAQGELVDPDGTIIKLRYDDRNRLHTAWVHYPFGYEKSEVMYGTYDTEVGEFLTAFAPIFPIDLGPIVSLDDLALGVDDSNVYLYWTTNVHAGPQAGSIQASFETFPIGETLQNRSLQAILVPTIYSLEFDDPASGLKTGPRVLMADLRAPMTSKIQDFRTNVIPTGEVVLAVRSPAEHQWRKVREQVNLVYFDNGSLSAYQPLTFTTTVSTFPNVVNDQNGYVSITWLEKASSDQYSVFFASTDPQMVSRFKTMSVGEALNLVYTVLFGMLIGALLSPIAAGVWLIAPLAVLALVGFTRRIFPAKVGGYISVAALVAAVGTVWLIKFAVFPLMLAYVPFSAWIPNIPAVLGEILRIGVPFLTLLLSGFIAWHFTYRRGNDSSLYFLLIYIGVDALITTSIYAVLIYGTYVQ